MPKKSDAAPKEKKTSAKRVPAAKTPAKKSASSARAKKIPVEKSSPASIAKKKNSASRKTLSSSEIGKGMDLVRRCVEALENKKARDIEVIHVGANSSVTDYYVIATGTSDPHLRSIRIELEKVIDGADPSGTVRVQNEPNSGWCVVDAFDVVVHVFSAEQRALYNLEELYAAGEKIEF